MILAHDEALKIGPAVYPFWRSDLKSFSVAKGSLNFMTDNIYRSKVPSKLVIGMVSNAGYSGEYDKNPFDFKHMNLNYLEVTVNLIEHKLLILKKEILFHPTYFY